MKNVFKPGDILELKDEIIVQDIGVTTTYGLSPGHKVPVLILPSENENLLPDEVRAAIAMLRKKYP